MTSSAHRTLWIGTYPAEGADAGSGEGIWRVDVAADGRFGTARRVVESPSPSFVALHPSGRTLYAVSETDPGAVTAFAVSDDGGLAPVRTLASGGDSPCHVVAAPTVLWVANYGDGAATFVELDAATGAFADVAGTESGPREHGPNAERQEGPHAHFAAVVPAPDGTGHDALVVDLGADAIRRYPARPWDLDRGSGTSSAFAALLPPGTGPRHLAVLAGGAVVVAGELDARLHVLTTCATDVDPRAAAAPAGDPLRERAVVRGWRPASSLPAAATAAPGGAPSMPSHVVVTPTGAGALLTVGVRGADVLAVHRVHDADGPAPTLEHLADIDLGAGAWPRHHEVLGPAEDGRWIAVVARQGTNDLAAVLIDPDTGLGEIVDVLPLPTPPACVLEAR